MANTAQTVFEQWLRERFQHRLATAQPLPETATLDALLQETAELATGSDFFLQPATLPEASDFGVLGYAIASANSLEQAADAALSHRLFNSANVRVTLGALSIQAESESVPQLTLLLEITRTMSDTANCAITEECISTIVGLLNWRQGLLGAAPLRVDYLGLGSRRRNARRDSALAGNTAGNAVGGGRGEDYRAHLGLEPVREARRTELTLHATSAESSPARNPRDQLTSILGRFTRALYQGYAGRDGLAAQLLNTLVESFGKVGRADLAAKALHTSERTMRRRLAQEQSSFQKVLDEYRAALAQDYLSTTTLSTQQIGELLGFTEATNFRRAFLRWMGESPHHYRAKLRSESQLS